MMRWPWRAHANADLLAVSWDQQVLAYVRARALPDGRFQISRCGVEREGPEGRAEFVRRLESLGLKACTAHVMLRPSQYQWLQIEAPGVVPDEMRAAARYQIRDLLSSHVDDVTIDVMRVGLGQQGSGASQLFVVAAPNAAVQSVIELGKALRWQVPVIEVQETAQRNLQTVVTRAHDRGARAFGALVVSDPAQAVLTICAGEELLYTRRLDVPADLLSFSWDRGPAPVESKFDTFALVEEYVPAHDAGDAALLEDAAQVAYAAANGATPAPPGLDAAQRFLLEVQRSLDVWDRTWSSLPLQGLQIYAGASSDALAEWLARELGQRVEVMDVLAAFVDFESNAPADLAYCWPLLGLFLREDHRKL